MQLDNTLTSSTVIQSLLATHAAAKVAVAPPPDQGLKLPNHRDRETASVPDTLCAFARKPPNLDRSCRYLFGPAHLPRLATDSASCINVAGARTEARLARSTDKGDTIKAKSPHRRRSTAQAGPVIGTRERIKISARRLFAEHGVEAVSVRDIIAAAGAKNGGSLNYYFGSKDALIGELLTDLFREMSDAWLLGLSEIDRNGGPQSVREIVRIILDPPVPMLVSDDSPTAARFLASMLSTRRAVVQELIEKMHFSAFSRPC